MAKSQRASRSTHLWSLVSWWRVRVRQRRMERLAQAFHFTPQTRILDVGGTPDLWRLANLPGRLVIVNLGYDAWMARQAGFCTVVADGCQLPFRNGSFDLVFSNSVIEHLGTAERQKQFAREIARVGKGYFVETPNRWFPLEQHLMTPLLHWLPRRWQQWVAPRFNLWACIERPTPDRREHYVQHYLQAIRLLDARSLRRLFPDSHIMRERWLGLTKALIAIRSPTASGANEPRSESAGSQACEEERSFPAQQDPRTRG